MAVKTIRDIQFSNLRNLEARKLNGTWLTPGRYQVYEQQRVLNTRMIINIFTDLSTKDHYRDRDLAIS